MTDARTKKLIQDGDRLWSQRQSLESLWQEIAYQFHVDMADFTISRYLGDDFADHLTTSYPLLVRRSLGDAFSALLRPRSLNNAEPGVWFAVQTNEEQANEDVDAKRWLEYATGVMRRAMYDRPAGFTRATKEADHMFATFGNAPMTLRLGKGEDHLLYQTHHLRDVVWTEDSEGQIDMVQRKWKCTMNQLTGAFGTKCSATVKERVSQEGHSPVEARHIIVASDRYEERDGVSKRFRTPWVSLWVDITNDHVMEEIGSWSQIYVIPRWVTLPGSQYASSPAVTAALPDARLIQAMTLTLLESGEKFADPPLIATQEAIRSDMQTFAGGTTWVDAEYDERLGDVLRPLYEPRAGEALRTAFEMTSAVHEQIAKAFFLDSISLPPMGVKEMTAFEVGQRISEWIRRAMPIFEPIEQEYNEPLCMETFDLMLRNGAFGPMADMPPILRGQSIQFKFESPLHESAERQKGQKFLEAQAALTQAAQLDPSVMPILNAPEALKDVLRGIGVPADWTRTDREVEEMQQQSQQDQMAQAGLEGAQAGSEISKNLGAAAKDFATAGGQQQPAPGLVQ